MYAAEKALAGNAQELRKNDSLSVQQMQDLPRMLIVWDWVPCFATGAGIILRRLFDAYPQDKLWLLTASDNARNTRPFDPIPDTNHQITVPQAGIRRRFTGPIVALINVLLIPLIVWRGIQLVRDKSADALFGVPWNTFFLSAYLIHKITKRPLYAYAMDDPLGSRSVSFFSAPLYSLLMPRILRAATAVWAVSSYMCESFQKRYSIRCLQLLPTLDVEKFRRACFSKRRDGQSQIRIAYTGAIYTAQVDAVRNLVRVLHSDALKSRRNGRTFALTLYTSLPETTLRRMGLMGPAVQREFIRAAEISGALSEADILFLPLSFAPEMNHVVRTSLPTKIAEYLASGVPLLVHAPSYSTVVRYCREHGCGLVVDEADPEKLLDALLRLATDSSLREELSAKALEAARKNHDLQSVLPAFLQTLTQWNVKVQT